MNSYLDYFKHLIPANPTERVQWYRLASNVYVREARFSYDTAWDSPTPPQDRIMRHTTELFLKIDGELLQIATII